MWSASPRTKKSPTHSLCLIWLIYLFIYLFVGRTKWLMNCACGTFVWQLMNGSDVCALFHMCLLFGNIGYQCVGGVRASWAYFSRWWNHLILSDWLLKVRMDERSQMDNLLTQSEHHCCTWALINKTQCSHWKDFIIVSSSVHLPSSLCHFCWFHFCIFKW